MLSIRGSDIPALHGKACPAHFPCGFGCCAKIIQERETNIPSTKISAQPTCSVCGKESQGNEKRCPGCGAELAAVDASALKVLSREQLSIRPGLTIVDGESLLWIKYSNPEWGPPVFMIFFGFLLMSQAFRDVDRIDASVYVFLVLGSVFLLYGSLLFPKPSFLSVRKPREADPQDPFRDAQHQEASAFTLSSGLFFRKTHSLSTRGIAQVFCVSRFYYNDVKAKKITYRYDVVARFADGRSVVLLPALNFLESAQSVEFLLEGIFSLKDEPMPQEALT
jgi:hypothetical protein